MPRTRPTRDAARPVPELSRASSQDERASSRAARLALAAILAASVAQVLFLFVGCDWELSPDEAEYWAWSRRLDWCYLAKGPLIAVVIRLGTTLFGGLSLALAGDLMPAVRLPAMILGALTAWGVFRLAQRACGGARAGLYAVLVMLAVPLFRVGGLLMTIDTPLIACWTWAALWSYRALADGRRIGWPIAGVLAALGVLAKYTMLAFPASVGFFLLVNPRHRRELIRPGFWVMSGLCALGMVPIVAWNATHSGAASHQMVDRVGILSPWNWGQIRLLLGFLGGEAAVWGIAWWVVGVLALRAAAIVVVRRGDESIAMADGRTIVRHATPERDGLLYLLCLWGVLWTTVVVVCFLGENELNWAAPGYVSVLCLAGWWLDRGPFREGWRSGRPGMVLAGCWLFGVLGLTALQHTEWFYPLIARWVPASTPGNPSPMKRVDPTCRMRGHRVLAPEVARRFAELKAEGLDPFILTSTPYLASELSFYMPGHPDVECLAFSYDPYRPVNQHDLWHPNPRFDVAAYKGRPALVVEDAHFRPSYADSMVKHGWFARAEAPARLTVREGGVAVAAWDIAVARDYQGPPSPERWRAILFQGRPEGANAPRSGKNDPPRR
jgi:hypothetical protein